MVDDGFPERWKADAVLMAVATALDDFKGQLTRLSGTAYVNDVDAVIREGRRGFGPDVSVDIVTARLKLRYLILRIARLDRLKAARVPDIGPLSPTSHYCALLIFFSKTPT